MNSEICTCGKQRGGLNSRNGMRHINSCKKRKTEKKRVSSTRWMSHDYALEAVMETFESIIDTLQHIRDT